MKIAISGATGRMGQSIVRLAGQDQIGIVGAITSSQSIHLGKDVGDVAGAGHLGVAIADDVGSALLGADVVIDFSRPEGLSRVLAVAKRMGIPVVSGTTRLDAAVEKQIDDAARVIPVLWAPNTSLGVQVLAELVAEAVKRLGLGFDIEVVETHHKAKVDSPSGTAVRLADAARTAREGLRAVHGREGNVGPRAAEEIGIFAMRGGDVIGDHSVHLLGLGERIELTHRATNRDLFARGALRAARFLVGKPAGRYTMAHVLAPA
ncbi:MAG TPA: 4-hydroxy-tetrahydrodipicolinate reductase [Polyangium sp.]|nr:4-hydroxy-tetrahydrodipicolinate reductase [Polyangium sp.]